jgi:hypothetical protein
MLVYSCSNRQLSFSKNHMILMFMIVQILICLFMSLALFDRIEMCRSLAAGCRDRVIPLTSAAGADIFHDSGQ